MFKVASSLDALVEASLMKAKSGWKNGSWVAAGFLAAGFLVFFVFGTLAQESATSTQSTQSVSTSDLQTMVEIIESVPPVSASQLTEYGTFWSAQHAPGTVTPWPPLPCNMWQLDAWPLGDGQYLLDDTNLDYAALAAVAQAAQSSTATPTLQISTMANSLGGSYTYGNPVCLTDMTASIAFDGSITARFSIIGGTNLVPYDILMSTNLAIPVANWNWLGIGYTSNNYTFTEQPADLAFYILAKPSQTMTVPWGDDSYGQCSTMPLGLTNVIAVSAGLTHTIALKSNGTVVTWGWPYDGGDYVPTNITGGITAIAAGAAFNDAVLTNGNVIAWGDILSNSPEAAATNVPTDATNVSIVSASSFHSLALRNDGTVVGWGYYSPDNGELPPPSGLSNIVAIAAGPDHDLAVNSSGQVFAWGDNDSGQTNVPPGLSNVVEVASDWGYSLALKSDGTVVAWGDNTYGETNVPPGLSNVVAIAAGGDPFASDLYYYPAAETAYGLALRKDGSVVAWGNGPVTNLPAGMTGVFAISGGSFHSVALRTGPLTPVVIDQPTDQYQVAGGSASFGALGLGVAGVGYQWQFNDMPVSGATNATLTLTNVSPYTQGSYQTVISDAVGSITSSPANFYLVTPPVISSQTLPTNEVGIYQSNLTLNVVATSPGQSNGFPISYQWQFDGTNILGQTSSNYTFTATNSGTYSLIVSNAAGSTTIEWQVTVIYPGAVVAWGSNANGELNAPFQLTNVISVAAGEAHGVVALDSGAVTNWGSYWTGTNFVPVTPPPPLTNALAVAAGSRHDLALKADGTVVAWGLNDFGQTNVPGNVTNAIAIAAGGQESLALLRNGTVVQWGQTNAPLPGGLINVTAIAAGTNFNLALLQNSTVVAWGMDNYGQTNVPAGLSNVVAIAAGGAHALALEQNGTVVAWGDNTNGETNVPTNLTNVMKIAAGDNHSIALRNDGTVVCWGDDAYGQTNVVNGLKGVKLIAGGGDFTLAVQFSTTVMYPINVSQDLLLIYNTNSADSATVLNYYLAHRPMVSGANVLGIGYPGVFVTNGGGSGIVSITNTTVYETITYNGFTNDILAPVQTWLNDNPTKRPQYVILFLDVPSRVDNSATTGANYPFNYGSEEYASVSYQMATNFLGWNPFITYINMGGTNACKAYINKLSDMDTNGSLIISAGAAEYGNTNYYFDDTRYHYGSPFPSVVSNAVTGVLDVTPTASVVYSNAVDNGLTDHITSGSNVAGYVSWGAHSSLGNDYASNHEVSWTGHSDWYLMDTIESFNGQRYQTGQGNFIQWFSSDAFGGIKYSNTPIGAVTSVDEPNTYGASVPQNYFGLWEAGKNFAMCAWNSRYVSPVQQNFQAIGDPLVIK